MNYPIDWTKDGEIKKLFSYQTRIGIAPKFGTCSIMYYQLDQDHAYKVILERSKLEGIDLMRKFKVKSDFYYIYGIQDGKSYKLGLKSDILKSAEQLYYR